MPIRKGYRIFIRFLRRLLRILSYIPLSVHLLSLSLIVILRLPSFFDLYVTPEESLYLLISKTIIDEGVLYRDAWFAGPPVMPSIYQFLYFLFGEGALLASRILACFYLYICAIYFNGLLGPYKLFKRYPGLPGLLLIFLLSVPWYTLDLNATLVALLPMLVALHTIIRLGEHDSASYAPLFSAGVWLTIGIMTSYKVVFFMMGILLSYLILKKVRLDELVTLLGGTIIWLIFWLLYLYFRDSLAGYWDIGALYYLDRVGFGDAEGYEYKTLASLQLWLYIWGPVLLLAIIGLVHFRTRYFSYVNKIRSVDVLMAIWLLSCISMMAFKWRRLEYQDFMLIGPPVAFYASKTLDFPLVFRLRFLLLLALLAFPTYLYLGYWAITFSPSLTWAKPGAEDSILHGGNLSIARNYEPVIHYFKEKEAPNGIWILANEPALYQELGFHCANKYTDFRIAFNKIGCFPHPKGLSLYSNQETDSRVFQQLKQYPPDFIIDPLDAFADNNSPGNFPYLQRHFPSILEGYQGKPVGAYMIYSKP